MSFGTAPSGGAGGTTVGQAQYVITLDTQALQQGMAQLEASMRAGSDQVVAALGGVQSAETQVSTATAAMAQSAEREMSQMATTMNSLKDTAAGAGEQFKGLAQTLIGMTAIGGVVQGISELDQQLKETITDTVDFGKESLALQRTMGGSIETASSFAAVFDRYGVASTQANQAMAIFSKALEGYTDDTVKAEAGGLNAAAALAKLGVETTNVDGTMKSTSEAFLETIDALNKQGAGFDTTQEKMVLFGRGWQSLGPILQMSSEQFTALGEEAANMGVTLTQDNVPSVLAYIKAQQDMNDAVEGLRIQIGEALLPVLTELFTALSSGAKDTSDGISPAIKGLSDNLKELVTWTEKVAEDANAIGTAFDQATQAINNFYAGVSRAELSAGITGLNPQGFGDQSSKAISTTGVTNVNQLTGANFAPALQGAPALPSASAQEDATRVAQDSAKAQAQAAQDEIQQQQDIIKVLNDRKTAVSDEASTEIKALQDEEQAAKDSYDAQLKQYQVDKDQQTRAAEAAHTATMAQIQDEEDATKKSYDAQIQAAKDANDQALAAAKDEHDQATAGIADEQKAAEDASKQKISDLTAERDAQFKAIDDQKNAQLKAIADQQQATQQARQQEDRDLQDQRQQEDRDNASQHQSILDNLKSEHDAAVQSFQDQRDEIAKTKQAALDAIQAELDARSQQHDAILAGLSDQTDAAHATHDATAQRLSDQSAADQAAHDATVANLQAEQQAAQDAHDAAVQSLNDQMQAEQDRHDQAITDLQNELTAEEAASQARQDAYAAEQNQLTKDHQTRLQQIQDEADAQKAAIQAQIDAINAANEQDTFAAQQAKLQQAVQQAQTGLDIANEIAKNTGDPNTVLAAQKALADAQAALDKANADRQTQLQKEALQQQLQNVQDAAAAETKAENDQYQTQHDLIQQEITDEQNHLKAVKDSIAQQEAAQNDELKNYKANIAAEIQAQDDQLKAIQKNIQAEIAAANDRLKQEQANIAAQQKANDQALAAQLANIQTQQKAEDAAYKAFQAAEAQKTKDANATATAQTDAINAAAANEAKQYAASTTTEQKRYADEQQRISDTRKMQDRAIQDNRAQEDQDFATHKQAVTDSAQQQHDTVDNLYNNEKDGLIAIEKNALAESISDFDQRRAKADETYNAEKAQIAATFTDKGTGLIPNLQDALANQLAIYDQRRKDADATYQNEKDRIYETFDKDTGSSDGSGLIPKLKYAYDATKQGLDDQIKSWQDWKDQTNQQIQSVIDQVQRLIDKINELNSKNKSAPVQGPDTVPGQAQGNQPGQKGPGGVSYGGAPLSEAQFDQGPDSIWARFGVATEQAACGPIALEALTRLYGPGVDIAEILKWAQANGEWNPQVGMFGGNAFEAMAAHFGISIGDVSQSKAIEDLENGIPIAINTRDHYFLAQGYDPNTGLFDMGYTGQSVYNQRYMTIQDIERHAGPIGDFFEPQSGAAPSNSSGSSGISSGGVIVDIPNLGVNFSVTVPGAPGATSTTVGRTAVSGNVDDWLTQALELEGKPASWLPYLEPIVQQESGGNPTIVNPVAVNGQHATGLMQMLPSTFEANRDKSLPDDINDPVANAAAALNYIAGRYGSPAGTPYFRTGSFSTVGVAGYSAGGIIPGPTALFDMATWRPYAIAGEVGPERVSPLTTETNNNENRTETNTFNVSGIGMNEVVRELQTMQRRAQMLKRM